MVIKQYSNKNVAVLKKLNAIEKKLEDHDKKSSYSVIAGLTFSIIGFSYAIMGIGISIKELQTVIIGVGLLVFSFIFFLVGYLIVSKKFKEK